MTVDTKDEIGADTLARQTVTLDGREFTVVDFGRRTAEMDLYLQRLLSLSGLRRMVPAEGERAEDYMVRLYGALVDSGYNVDVLAGRLVPAGAPPATWSAEIAAETARHIGRCNTPEDRDRIMALGVRTVCEAFFLAGLERLNHDLERSKHG